VDTNFNVALWINQKIFRLQITVDDFKCMQILECKNDLCSVEPRVWLTAKDTINTCTVATISKHRNNTRLMAHAFN